MLKIDCMKERFLENLKYIWKLSVFSFFYTILIFVVFMFSRRFQSIDPHITGAFALFPVASVLTIFYVMFLFEYFKEKKRKKEELKEKSTEK